MACGEPKLQRSRPLLNPADLYVIDFKVLLVGLEDPHSVRDRSFGDFSATVRARSNENLASNKQADLDLIFGWQDPNNYYFLMANTDVVSHVIPPQQSRK